MRRTPSRYDRGHDARSAEAAVLSLDACGGGKPDCAGVWDRGVAPHRGAVPQGLGHEPAETGPTDLRKKRCGQRALAEAGIPAIARQAKRDKAAIYWGDEMGLRSDHVTGTSDAPVGRPPVVRATGQRFGCNMISAITNKGALAFMVFQGKFTSPIFVAFMQRLLKQVDGTIYLIVDGHPVHKSGKATHVAATHSSRLRLIRLPGYCPELNPDEWLNQDIKTNGLGKNRPTDRTELMAIVRSHLYRRQKQPQVITNLFHEKHVRYAASPCVRKDVVRVFPKSGGER
jgi:transposase